MRSTENEKDRQRKKKGKKLEGEDIKKELQWIGERGLGYRVAGGLNPERIEY